MKISTRIIREVVVGLVAVSALAVVLLIPQVAPAASSLFDDAATNFKTKCASCHGVDGSGNTAVGRKLKVNDLRSAEVKKMSDAQMNTIITNGKGKMPPAKLDAAQIKGVVAYIRSLQK